MPIAVLFTVNLVLVAAIVGLVHWLGRSAKARLDSADTATSLFRIEFPAAKIAEIVLTGAGDGALLALEGETAIGLVTALGANWLVRKVEPQNFGAARVTGNSKLVLRLKDFTAPHLTLDLGSAQQATLWRDRLEALRARRPVQPRLEAVRA